MGPQLKKGFFLYWSPVEKFYFQDKGGLKCACSNASILYVKPEPDPTAKEKLSNLKTTYGLTAEPEISAAFYFDLAFRTFIAAK